MRKNRLLVSALCVSMVLTQLPLNALAMASYDEESISYADEVLYDLSERPDFTKYGSGQFIVLTLDGVEAYGEASNIYILNEQEAADLTAGCGGETILKSGDIVSLCPDITPYNISFRPVDYDDTKEYKIISYILNNPEFDENKRITANSDGSYTMEIGSGDKCLNISASIAGDKTVDPPTDPTDPEPEPVPSPAPGYAITEFPQQAEFELTSVEPASYAAQFTYSYNFSIGKTHTKMGYNYTNMYLIYSDNPADLEGEEFYAERATSKQASNGAYVERLTRLSSLYDKSTMTQTYTVQASGNDIKPFVPGQKYYWMLVSSTKYKA